MERERIPWSSLDKATEDILYIPPHRLTYEKYS
jgi:hypothetical protein